MEKYYLILSEGAYSDYSPTYYVGDKLITQEEFDVKGREVGDEVESWFATLPEKEFKDWRGELATSKYDPATDEKLNSYSLASIWNDKMATWIKEQGFVELPENIPEINVSYSEIPTSRDNKS